MRTRLVSSVVSAPLVIGAFLIVVATFMAREHIINIYENVSYALVPSAQRAFAIGERHFSAQDPAAYDVDRAQYFFKLAESQDRQLPYLYHELARISFLKGELITALAQVNTQISLFGDHAPNSYYVRALIEGFMGEYGPASRDYEHYLAFDPHNWAAINDYTWVLLKAQRYEDASVEATKGLTFFPDNPWLLNSDATALYELGRYDEALRLEDRAQTTAARLSSSDWLKAYPGNDPKIADVGLEALKNAIAGNVHAITTAQARATDVHTRQ